MAVAEEVDAGPGRGAAHEVPLAVHAARARSRQLLEVGDRAGAALLREPDQREQDLRGRLGVRERAVAGRDRRAEEVRERGQAHPLDASPQQVARERDGVEHRRGEALAGEPVELAVDEAGVEAGVVRDEQRVAGERAEAPQSGAHARRTAELLVAQPGQPSDLDGERHAGCDEGLERRGGLETLDADGADLADTGRGDRQAGRLEVEDDEGRLLEQRRLDAGEHDRAAAPGEAGVLGDERLEQRAGEPGRRTPQREHVGRGIDGGDAAAPLLEELGETIERVEGELHAPH